MIKSLEISSLFVCNSNKSHKSSLLITDGKKYQIVNINLNGNEISASEKVFLVDGGELNITGKGTIKETKPNYGAIMVKGSGDPNDKGYSVVNVSKDVTLEGWSGIFITHNNSKSYGVDVSFAGKINSVNDTSGETGVGIYVNGKIKDNVVKSLCKDICD